MTPERDYRSEYRNRKVYVLQADMKVKGVWSNLKKLCEEMKIADPDFLTYSSLSKRKADENPIKFETEKGVKYEVYMEVLK